MDKHNPDTNPNWTPLLKIRKYQCVNCGNVISTTTNHTGICYPFCKGSCRQIINAGTSREVVLPKQTKHFCIEG